MAASPSSDPEPQKAASSPMLTQAQAFQELVRRAGEGNDFCLAGLRKHLDERPEIWMAFGDSSKMAERHWIELLAAGNKLVEESIPRRLKELKAELAGPNPTPLEKLLVDVVGVSFLAAQHGEIAAANTASGSLQQADHRLRKAESGQRRLLRAVKTLATVRELLSRGPNSISRKELSSEGNRQSP